MRSGVSVYAVIYDVHTAVISPAYAIREPADGRNERFSRLDSLCRCAESRMTALYEILPREFHAKALLQET